MAAQDPTATLLAYFGQRILEGWPEQEAFDDTVASNPIPYNTVSARALLPGEHHAVPQGSRFRYRNELILAGLHTHKVPGICIGNDGVAVCGVANYRRHNYTFLDLYVYGSAGGGLRRANSIFRQRVMTHQTLLNPWNIAMLMCMMLRRPFRLVLRVPVVQGMKYYYAGLFFIDHVRQGATAELLRVYEFPLRRVHPPPAPFLDPAFVLLLHFHQRLQAGRSHRDAFTDTVTEHHDHYHTVYERAMATGHHPAIPVGMMFRYRYELILAGLHTHYEAGICIGGDDRAVCGVAAYPRHNYLEFPYFVFGAAGADIRQANNVYHWRVLRDQTLFNRWNIAMLRIMGQDIPFRLVVRVPTAEGLRYCYVGVFMIDFVREILSDQGFRVYEFMLVPLLLPPP